MKYFIQLDEKDIDPLLDALTLYLDTENGEYVIDPEYEKILNKIIEVLINIKNSMNDKLNDEEIEEMKKRFPNIGDNNDV